MNEHGRGVSRFEAEIEHELIGERYESRVNRQLGLLERERDGHDGHVLALADLRPENAVVQRLRRVDSQLLQDGNVVKVNFGQTAHKVVARPQS